MYNQMSNELVKRTIEYLFDMYITVNLERKTNNILK